MSDEAIQEIEGLLQKQLDEVRAANKRTTMIGGVLVLIVAAYLGWAYSQLSKLIDPEGLALAATGLTLEAMPDASAALRGVVVDGAPDIAGAATQALVDMVPAYREVMEQELTPVVDEVTLVLAQATVRSMIKSAKDKTGGNAAEQVAMQAGADAVVAHNRDRPEKRMSAERGEGERIRFYEARDEKDEAQHVVQRILEGARGEGHSHGHYAVFYRTNAQSRPIEEELLKYDVPYVVVGGVRFYDRAEVKDALAFLRLALNPADAAALRRIVNRPARGIGKTTLERAERLARIIVSDISLYYQDRVDEGILEGNWSDLLAAEIKEARRLFSERFPSPEIQNSRILEAAFLDLLEKRRKELPILAKK